MIERDILEDEVEERGAIAFVDAGGFVDFSVVGVNRLFGIVNDLAGFFDDPLGGCLRGRLCRRKSDDRKDEQASDTSRAFGMLL